MEEMEGVVAQLIRYAKDGERIGSEIVFRPFCEYYMPKAGDEYAETEFTDIEAFIKEFGNDVAKKVLDGEIVEVKRKYNKEDFEFRRCDPNIEITKYEYPVKYPIEGHKEVLIKQKKGGFVEVK